MRAVIQRVKRASVTANNQIVSSIDQGLCILVGIHCNDTPLDAQKLADKILKLKLFSCPNTSQMWKKSVSDLSLPILCVSQFTLFAKTSKGNKPDFHLSMKSADSKPFYENFLAYLKGKLGADRVFDGVFGEMMDVEIVNDGPVTIILDTMEGKEKEKENLEN
ncbi:D-tyrosyl-tRNA deacylase [Rozella allomycis CSF55]|uniref:D-aminoacyl-tRNA deacylase n=1 Tax=Rozella allomycis (strain CSF55) TaxID=988480 RepID=A0A4P9YAL7_ROZAC|nr:D-tyrosyl-tRNA deacylase [Rozella allomycis CSF55]